MAARRILLIGPPALVVDDSPVPLSPERRNQVLAYLACRRDWVSRDQLAGLFWPEHGQDAARRNVRKVLFRLREAGFDESLEMRGENVRLRVETDLAQWRAADGDIPLELYRGPLLAGFEVDGPGEFVNWLLSERRRVYEDWRVAMLRSVAASDPYEQVRQAQRMLDEDGFDEDALAAYLGAQNTLGRTAEAAKAFKNYAKRLAEELAIEPSMRLRAMVADASSAVARTGRPQEATNTADLDDFVGRRAELQQLLVLLKRDDGRVVTVTGVGGIGKSRLVRRLMLSPGCREAGENFFVPLEDLNETSQVAIRVARVLGANIGGNAAEWDRVVDIIGERRVLLVFDNAEHLGGLSEMISVLVERCSQLRLLVTSRTRLQVPGERVLSVSGLPVPAAEDLDCADAFDAVRLFVLRARAVSPEFELHAHREAVCGIVTRLGGHPLAIQLAAGWSRLLPPAEIARAVDDSLDLLASAPGATATRPEHSSMRATLEQSWSLLAPSERNALVALSVFAGSFDRTAARHVAGAALPLLASLCDKSLIEADSAGRFALHPVVRTYGAEKLTAGPAAEYRRLHAEHYCGRLAKVTDFDALDQSAALRGIELELVNIIAAWDQAILLQRSDLLADAATAVERFYDLRGPQRQGIDMLARAQRALSCHRVSDHRAMWRVALGHANLLWAQGHFGEVVAPAQAALSSARQLDDQYAIKSCLNTLGLAAWNLGQLGDARRYVAEALERARRDGSPFEIAVYTGNLLLIERSLGELDTAYRLAQEALTGYRQCKHREGEAAALGHIAQLLLDQDRPAEAVAALQEALGVIHEAGFTAMRSTPLMRLAQAHFALGELPAARVAATRALENARTLGERRVVPLCLAVMSRIEFAAGDSAAALECLSEAARVCRPMNSARTTHEVLIWSADAYLRLGQLDIAGQIVAALKPFGDIGVPEAAELRALERRLDAAGGCPVAEGAGMSIDQALRIVESPRSA